MIVAIDTRQIIDKASFHEVFAGAFGFFDGYGKNMNAWIDCMSYLDEPDGMTQVYCQPGETICLQLNYAADLAERMPELFQTLLDCTAFVNWRRTEKGEQALLALSYYK